MSERLRTELRRNIPEMEHQYLFGLDGHKHGKGKTRFDHSDVPLLQNMYSTFLQEVRACTYEHESRIAQLFDSRYEFVQLQNDDSQEFARRIQLALCSEAIRNASPQCAHTGGSRNLLPNPYGTEIYKLHQFSVMRTEWLTWQDDISHTITDVDRTITDNCWDEMCDFQWRLDLQAPIIEELNRKRIILRDCVKQVLEDHDALPEDTTGLIFVELSAGLRE